EGDGYAESGGRAEDDPLQGRRGARQDERLNQEPEDPCGQGQPERYANAVEERLGKQPPPGLADAGLEWRGIRAGHQCVPGRDTVYSSLSFDRLAGQSETGQALRFAKRRPRNVIMTLAS